jgi:hypothetical protein
MLPAVYSLHADSHIYIVCNFVLIICVVGYNKTICNLLFLAI